MIGLAISLWLTNATLCGIFAQQKGRSVTGWTIFGLVFGFLALILLAFRGTTCRACRFCASSIPLQATVCRFCARDT